MGNQFLKRLNIKRSITSYKLGCLKRLIDTYFTLISRCHNLVYASFCYCEHVTDAGVELLGTLPSLMSLDLSGCNIQDQGVAALGNNPRFRDITLAECPNITDLGLQVRTENLRESVGQSVSQSASQLVTHSPTHSLVLLLRRSVYQWVARLVCRSVSHSFLQSVGWSVSHSVSHKSVSRSVLRPFACLNASNNRI